MPFLGRSVLTIRAVKVRCKFRYGDCRPRSISLGPDARIQVLENGAEGSSKSVLLSTKWDRILFNCGESAELGFSKQVTSVFITHLDWSRMGGLIGLLYKASAGRQARVHLGGPPGIGNFVIASESFLWCKTLRINLLDFDSGSQFTQNGLIVQAIPIREELSRKQVVAPLDESSMRKNSRANPNQNSRLLACQYSKKEVDKNTCYSFICKSKAAKAWMIKECVEKGVLPGEDMVKLWTGIPVVLSDGTIVKPEDVIRTESFPSLIVLDCPSKGYLDDLLQRKEYEELYASKAVGGTIVHFTPVDVMNDERYISWMERFPQDTRHVIVNESNLWDNSKKVIHRHEVCRLISSRVFPKLRSSEKQTSQEHTARSIRWSDSEIYVKEIFGGGDEEQLPDTEWIRKWGTKFENFKLIQSYNGTVVSLLSHLVARPCDPFEISNVPTRTENHSKVPSTMHIKNPRVTFLGTSSQACSGHRYTAGILVEQSDNRNILLDCGNGTVSRLATLFDSEQLQKVLTSIRVIFVSHTHADHHAGLIGVLKAMKDAWTASGKQSETTILLLPPPLIGWIEDYHTQFEPLFDNIQLVSLQNMVSRSGERRPQQVMLNKAVGTEEIAICWARHPGFSYSISIKHSAGWKISYSGDSMYNKVFCKMGLNSDLLIQEATFASGMELLARRAQHCTTEEAIRVGVEMRAKHIILTHFSRRFPVVPCLSDLKNTSNVGVAFDFLQVTLEDLPIIPKLNAAYDVVFYDYLKDAEQQRNKAMKRGSQDVEETDEEDEEWKLNT